MEISNPRRILAVSLEEEAHHLGRVIQDLTGAPPSPAAPSLAGATHHLPLRTAYYAAEVPVWLDLVASPAEWAASFLSAEAREVLGVLGGVVVVFPLSPPSSPPPPPSSAPPPAAAAAAAAAATPASEPASPGGAEAGAAPADRRRELVAQVGRVVREGLGGWEWDGVGLGVGVGEAPGGQDELDAWHDCCAEWGLEFVHATPGQKATDRNEFGEKVGIQRVLEALESNDWAAADAGGSEDGSEFGDFEGPSGERAAGPGKAARGGGEDDGEDDEEAGGLGLDPESLGFGFDREDFAGLRQAIWSAGGAGGEGAEEDEEPGEGDVQKLEQMMRKLQAVRDMSAGLPEEQRKRMAKRAVGEVMKEL